MPTSHLYILFGEASVNFSYLLMSFVVVNLCESLLYLLYLELVLHLMCGVKTVLPLNRLPYVLDETMIQFHLIFFNPQTMFWKYACPFSLSHTMTITLLQF